MPRISDFYAVVHDDDGEPCGVTLHIGRLGEAVNHASTSDVLHHLHNLDTLAHTLTALHLADAIAHRDPSTTLRVEHRATALCANSDVYRWQWGTSPDHTQTLEVGRIAAKAVLALLRLENRRMTHWIGSAGKVRAAQLNAWRDVGNHRLGSFLCDGVAQALRNPIGAMPTRILLGGFATLLQRREDVADAAAALGDVLVAAVADAELVSERRVRALDDLRWIIRRNPRGTALIFERALSRAVVSLVAELKNPMADFRIRQYVRANLAELSPRAVDQLQDEGCIQRTRLPAPESLLSPYGTTLGNKVTSAAAAVTPDQVLAGLANPDERNRLSAICLAPAVAKRSKWHELARELLGLVCLGEIYPLAREDQTIRRVDLGSLAASQLLKLLAEKLPSQPKYNAATERFLEPPGPAQTDFETSSTRDRTCQATLDNTARSDSDAAAELFWLGLDAVINRGLTPRLAPAGPVSKFARTIKLLPLQHATSGRRRLLECFRSRDRSAEARFLAYYACQDRGTDQVALELLQDPTEDPGFRALLGTVVLQWQPQALAEFLDRSVTPWKLCPGAIANVPASEPGDRMPLRWLAASLAGADHPHVKHRTAQLIESRLKLQHGAGDFLAQQEATLSLLDDEPGILRALRSVIDDKSPAAFGRWSAAILISLLGQSDDEGRLIECATTIGSWTTANLRQSGVEVVQLFLNTQRSDQAAGDVWNLLQPYLDLGFGFPHADRIAAKMLVVLADRHGRAGRPNHALATYTRALELDRLNLNARQALRALT